MQKLAMALLLISNVCFAKTNLIIGSASTDQFKAEVSATNPMQVVVENRQTQKSQTMSFKNSVSDIKKLTITKTNVKKSNELLLVVLSVFDKEQTVLVIDLQKDNKTLCSLRNEGDFSWADDQELMERVSLTSKDQLQIKIGNRKTGSTKFSWVNCATL